MGSRARAVLLDLKAALVAVTPTAVDVHGDTMGWTLDFSPQGVVGVGLLLRPNAIRPARGTDPGSPVQLRIIRIREPDDLAAQIGSTEHRLQALIQGWIAPTGTTDEDRGLDALTLWEHIQAGIQARCTRIGGDGTSAPTTVRLNELLFTAEQGHTYGYVEASVEVRYRARIRRTP